MKPTPLSVPSGSLVSGSLVSGFRESWSLVRSVLLSAVVVASACSSVSTVRLQPEAIEVGPGLRPVAGLQADAISFYFLFIPIPGVDLDEVVNERLVVTAKSMGADKIANLQFHITPGSGIWALLRILGYRSAEASGIAVQVKGPAPDPDADRGPEAPVSPPSAPAPAGPESTTPADSTQT